MRVYRHRFTVGPERLPSRSLSYGLLAGVHVVLAKRAVETGGTL